MRRAGEVVSKSDDPRARLGLRLRRRPQHRRGLRAPAAPADRRAVRAGISLQTVRLVGLPAGGRRMSGREPPSLRARATAGRHARCSPCSSRSASVLLVTTLESRLTDGADRAVPVTGRRPARPGAHRETSRRCFATSTTTGWPRWSPPTGTVLAASPNIAGGRTVARPASPANGRAPGRSGRPTTARPRPTGSGAPSGPSPDGAGDRVRR